MSHRTGQCLCGSVQFEARVEPDIQLCHCLQCQRWTGGGPLASVRVHDLKMTGEENVATFQASEWGERAYCKSCGSTLFWRMQGRPTSFVTVGLLNDQSGLVVTEEIFVDYRPEWLPPWANATQSTEAEEMAKLDAFLSPDRQ